MNHDVLCSLAVKPFLRHVNNYWFMFYKPIYVEQGFDTLPNVKWLYPSMCTFQEVITLIMSLSLKLRRSTAFGLILCIKTLCYFVVTGIWQLYRKSLRYSHIWHFRLISTENLFSIQHFNWVLNLNIMKLLSLFKTSAKFFTGIAT